MKAARPFHILLVEDNCAERRLVSEAMKDTAVPVTLETVPDGAEALFLLFERKTNGKPLPDLILLDLNLPGKDGREVLDVVKGDGSLKHIPTVVLTSSRAEKDCRRCLDAHANSYVIKPDILEEYFEMLRALVAYWIRVVPDTSPRRRPE